MRHAVFCYDSHAMESVLHCSTYFDETNGFEWRARPYLDMPSELLFMVRTVPVTSEYWQLLPNNHIRCAQLTPEDTALGNEWHVESSFSVTETIAAMDAISEFDPIDYLVQHNKYYGRDAPDGPSYDMLIQLFQMMYSNGKGAIKTEDVSFDGWMKLVLTKMHTNGVFLTPTQDVLLLECCSQSSDSQDSGCKRTWDAMSSVPSIHNLGSKHQLCDEPAPLSDELCIS